MKCSTVLRTLLVAIIVVSFLFLSLKAGERLLDRARLREVGRVSAPPPPAMVELKNSVPGYEQRYITTPGTFRMNHGSSITELPDHSLLCTWYAGTREAKPETKIYSSRFDPEKKTWSVPIAVAGYGERAEWSLCFTRTVGNTALFVDDDGIVWMFYASVQTGGWTGARVDYKTSHDAGRTWSRAKTLVHMWSNMPRSKPLRLGPNRFAIPLYHNIGRKHGYTCTVSVAGGKITSKSYEAIPGIEQTQPALVRRSENELFAYLRDPTKQSLIFARFDVARKRWSDAERLALPNPNSAVDTEQTPDGRTLLVYNSSKGKRVPLSLAYSNDGRDFRKIFDFDDESSGRSFSYPAIIRADNGMYHLTYSCDERRAIKHVQFSQQWLDEKIAAASP